MRFNIGAGLSEAGKGLAQTAQAWTLEAQRAEIEKDKVRLADMLSSARESAGRAETHKYGMMQQAERIAAEAPEREARTASLKSGTSRAEDEDRRKREAGEGVSSILSGGGKPSGGTYAERIAGYEGGTKKGGMVPNELGSGAFGPYQFMPETWRDVRAKNPDLALPEDIKQATKEQHRAAFDKFTADNAAILEKGGIEPTAANLYLAHRFGAGGAQKIIGADDNARLSEILPIDWQKQNPDMRGQTVGGFKRLAEERMAGVTVETGAGAGAADDMPAELRRTIARIAPSNPDKAAELVKEFYLEQSRGKAREAALVPDEARTAEWLRRATPEQRKAYQESLRAKLKPVAPPAEVQTAEWLRNATPEQRKAFEEMEALKRGPQKLPEAFKKLETEVRTVGGAIDRFEQVVKKYGGGSLLAFLNDPTSKEAQEYNTAFTAMKTALRSEAFVNTGVLQPAEMAMLDKELLAPTTIRGLLSNPEAYKAKMDELRRYLDNKIQSSYKSHGQELPPDLKFYKEAQEAEPPRIATPKEYDALKPNTKYYAPDGSLRTKR